MLIVKNILFVSYLKNKGIRRLCFILGCIIFCFQVFKLPHFYNSVRIKHEYVNFNDFRKDMIFAWNINPIRFWNTAECCRKHFEKEGIKDASFICLPINELPENKIIDLYPYPEIKNKLNSPISLDCGMKKVFIIRPIFMVFSFYLPFILAIILKFLWLILLWIYKGFKEN